MNYVIYFNRTKNQTVAIQFDAFDKNYEEIFKKILHCDEVSLTRLAGGVMRIQNKKLKCESVFDEPNEFIYCRQLCTKFNKSFKFQGNIYTFYDQSDIDNLSNSDIISMGMSICTGDFKKFLDKNKNNYKKIIMCADDF